MFLFVIAAHPAPHDSPHRTGDTEHQGGPGREWLGRLSLVAALGALLGVIDFVVFEALSRDATFVESALAKPTFWSLSYFSWQFLAFSVVASGFFIFFSLLRVLTARHKRILPLDALVSASVSLCGLMIIALRYMKNGSEVAGLAVLIASVTILVVLPLTGFSSRKLDLPSGRRLPIVLAGVFLLSFFAPELYLRLPSRDLTPAPREQQRPNVVFIVLDTLRVDRLMCYGYARNPTPSIDALATEGVLFLNAFSAAPWTVPSHASMFTGLQTADHHADWGYTYLDPRFVTIAEYLQQSSYRTAAFSENPFVGRSAGFAQGFDEFHEIWRRPMLLRGIAELLTRADLRKERQEYSKRTSALASRWIKRQQNALRPYFVYINLMTAHLPRYPRSKNLPAGWPRSALERVEPVNLVPERYYLPQHHLDDELMEVVSDIYDQEIAYLDQVVGEFIQEITSAGCLDNSILIITSDHGESFGDHGFFEHQFSLYNSLIKVPLILIYRESLEPKIVTVNVSTASLFSTIVTLALGPEAVPRALRNQEPLHLATKDHTVFSEYSNGISMLKSVLGSDSDTIDLQRFDRSVKSVIAGTMKYIMYSDETEELFDLSSDPAETYNVVDRRPADRDRLNALVASRLGSFNAEMNQRASPALDPQTQEALQKLGYVR